MGPAQGTQQYEKEHEEEDGASREKVKRLGEKFALSTTNNRSSQARSWRQITSVSSSFTKRRQEPLHMGGFSGTLSGDDLDLCARCRFHVVHVSSGWERDQFYTEQEAVDPQGKISCRQNQAHHRRAVLPTVWAEGSASGPEPASRRRRPLDG